MIIRFYRATVHEGQHDAFKVFLGGDRLYAIGHWLQSGELVLRHKVLLVG